MKKFEYLTVKLSCNEFPSDKYLKTKGQEGWELASTVPLWAAGAIILIFKRELICT